MARSSPGELVVTLGDDESAARRFAAADDLSEYLEELSVQPEGKVAACMEYGDRPWWQRFLGMSEKDFALEFAIEWSGEFACLIFFDDAGSEYRVLDREMKAIPAESIRRRLSHGELTPAPSDECMTTTRAWAALHEYLRFDARPTWLDYRYVR